MCKCDNWPVNVDMDLQRWLSQSTVTSLTMYNDESNIDDEFSNSRC